MRSERFGPVVLGGGGLRHLDSGTWMAWTRWRRSGRWPRRPCGASTGSGNVGDLAVISMLDPETDEVAAFEELVGSHGGLGGAQTEAFLLYPAAFAEPAEPIVGAPAVHGVLVGLAARSWAARDRAPGRGASARTRARLTGRGDRRVAIDRTRHPAIVSAGAASSERSASPTRGPGPVA